MARNVRQAVRVTGDFRAELFHAGRVAECQVLNLSAGGASISAKLRLAAGSHCTLGLDLDDALAQHAGVQDGYLSFHLEVLECIPDADDPELFTYRTRNLTRDGAPEYERAVRLVFAVQRERLAAASGADEASPMAMDDEGRQRRRARYRIIPRFWRSPDDDRDER